MKLVIAVLKLNIVLMLHLANGAYVVHKAHWHGHNVCIMGSERTDVTLQLKYSRKSETKRKDCGITQGPIINCEEHVTTTIVSQVPKVKTSRVNKIDCCPGWKERSWFGCHKQAPCISLPQHTPSHCKTERNNKLVLNRKTYNLDKPPRFPSHTLTGKPGESLQKLFLFPLVKLTYEQSVALARQDPDELPWLLTYRHLQNGSLEFLKEHTTVKKYNSTADFENLLKVVRKLFTTDDRYLPYFRYPSLVEKWKDIIHCDTWQEDQVFVEQRLAALNPMSLQRVTAETGFYRKRIGLKLSELRQKFNFKFNWDYAISDAVGHETTLYRMAKTGSVFAAHFPHLDEIPNVPDITNPNEIKGRKLKTATSPIALFVSVKSPETKQYQLKPVAIQIDSYRDSPVYMPKDGNRWLLAKQLYQLADFGYVEMIEHLLKTHMILQAICITAKRTISEFHPLGQLFKWHCRGLTATNVNGLPKLILPGQYMHTLFSMGHTGSIELLNRAYRDYSWKDNDFWENIKKRGVDDQEKLPYFPYRDDGYLIWKQLQSYVQEYVSLYYGYDSHVSFDNELQHFTNELSADGYGATGGLGKLKGFPRRLCSKSSLVETLSRILWLPIQHNAVNYPIAYYGAFVPNMPSKLYDDPRGKAGEYSFYTLPDSNVATVQAVVSMSLGSLRFDNLLDYGPKMVDKDAAELVKKHRNILMTRIRGIIEQRNNERFRNGHLTYPYLKPGWIPNSIHT